ncbi:exo-alpha-sialidase [Streptomyces sp. NBC_00006]|uniref:sialidase family protein n=1 Tax=unclassified Streptomyces TaxID=2593676 RepID=UPI00225B9A5F|nr:MULTISPECIES: exo-alpha-sialidase [unclassified Streptomyces]MCX5530182.1 exo-alpha-sialidase [Streptomyces sp. NBC_00006]
MTPTTPTPRTTETPTLPGHTRTDRALPTPTVQSHAANLTVLPDGELGCVWFGGTQEGMADICVWFSRLPAGAAEWSEPQRLSDDPDRSEQNPILTVLPSGEWWLLHTAQQGGRQDTAQVRLRISRDRGGSWAAPRTLFSAESGGVFVRQPPVVLPTGRILLPVFRCTTPEGVAWTGEHDTSAVMVSDDGGTTWREHTVPASTGLVHMNVHALPDGSLLALYRSRRADHVHRSVSYDEGTTWTEPEPLDLPNNNSSVQYVPLTDGRLALVYNHSSAADATDRRVSLYDEIDESGDLATQAGTADDDTVGSAFWGAPRAPLSLALSPDGGRTWQRAADLVTGDGHCMTNNSRDGLNRELSYPSVTQSADGALHIAYTHHRKGIRHIQLTPHA